MAITTAMIKELREATGAGILDSKKALEQTDGDFDKAVNFLREKGLAKAAKKASRDANEGQIAIKVENGRASLIEVNCETDFVARNDDFQNFVDSIVEQVFDNPALTSVEALLETDYIKSPGTSVADAIQEAISKLGENIIVKRLTQYTQSGPGTLKGYSHPGGRIGVVVELGVDNASAEGEQLDQLAHDIALQIAAINPLYLAPDDVPAAIIESERNLLLAQLADDNKPDNIKAKIVDGRMSKFYKENCLTEQAFVKDDSLSINQLLQQHSKALGTPIKIKRYTRYELGAE